MKASKASKSIRRSVALPESLATEAMAVAPDEPKKEFQPGRGPRPDGIHRRTQTRGFCQVDGNDGGRQGGGFRMRRYSGGLKRNRNGWAYRWFVAVKSISWIHYNSQ